MCSSSSDGTGRHLVFVHQGSTPLDQIRLQIGPGNGSDEHGDGLIGEGSFVQAIFGKGHLGQQLHHAGHLGTKVSGTGGLGKNEIFS